MDMLEPAKTVIEICGGFAAVSKMLDRSESRVRRWCQPKAKGGTDGFVPSALAQQLLKEAKSREIELRPDHFFVLEP